jgi:aspartyl-tRNA(Asn)/glutamyl-tRNA(Gln) amidotransferase subunit A
MTHHNASGALDTQAITQAITFWSGLSPDENRVHALAGATQSWHDALERLRHRLPVTPGRDDFTDVLKTHAAPEHDDDTVDALNATTHPHEPDWWEQRQRVLRGQISLAELAQRSIERLQQLNAHAHVCTAITTDSGMAHAHELDKQLAAGTLLPPLAGMPSAHKDLLFRSHQPVSCGMASPPAFASMQTAAALQILQAQQILDLGQLHLTELALDPSGLNDGLGLCPNPWSPDHVPGGSSSGSGAAVGARAVYGALGSDTAGSIRVPSMLCGVTGLKPTYGTLPTDGAMTLSHTHDHLGPMASSARDCALMLAPFIGKQPDQATPKLGLRTKGLRMGVPERFFHNELDGAAKTLIENSLSAFESLGVQLVNVPDFDYEAVNALGSLITRAEACAMYSRYVRSGSGMTVGPLTQARILEGMAAPAFAYAQALALRAPLLQEYLSSVMAGVDVLHVPVAPIAAPRYTQVREGAPGQATTLDSLIRMTRPFNYFGLPALSLPCGHLSDNGTTLPFGFQLVGKPFADWQLVKLGNAYQAVTDWHTRVPGQN